MFMTLLIADAEQVVHNLEVHITQQIREVSGDRAAEGGPLRPEERARPSSRLGQGIAASSIFKGT